MSNYYNLNIIPIILNRFKVNDVVICGLDDDDSTINIVLKYCDMNDVSYTAIDSKSVSDEEGYALNVLPNLNDYDAVFINDDPNWYTVYNELKIIKNNNDEFPLVFICHNVFPHKRRDSYIDPKIIPEDFRNEFSKKFEYGDIYLYDGFYHAIEENTPKNGVLTAIEDFIVENPSIGIMDVKLVNGVTILYPKNNISKIRLGLLSEEIQGHDLEFDELSDNIVENQLLSNYVSRLNISSEDLKNIDDIKFELSEKENIINDYENKIMLHDDELNYKDSQIEGVDLKLSLKDTQIKNFESKLINRDNEIDTLSNKLQNANDQINLLKEEINTKNKTFENKSLEFNAKINEANSKISSLENDIFQKEKIELELNNQLKIANNQIQENINQINMKDNCISDKDNQILIKQKEITDKKRILETMKQQCTNQLSKLDNKEYCISCYKEEIVNNHLEIQYLKKGTLLRKFLSPFAYVYLIIKSKPKELSINFKLYKAIKNSKCFDIGYYLANNKDIHESKWCKYFSPELHYVCNGFSERRKFNKKYFNRSSKEELFNYLLKCDE